MKKKKKNCGKQPLQNITQQRNRIQKQGNILKIIQEFKKFYNNLLLFSLKAKETFSKHIQLFMVGLFCEKKLKAKSC